MTTVLPADDAFTENATVYGYSPNLWLRCRPIPTATATVSLSGSTYTIAHKPGHITDAYTQLIIGGQTVADTGLIDNGRAMICGLYRSVYATEVAVECDYNIRYQGGSQPLDGTDYFFGCGLWARVSGGTISGPNTRDEFHQDVTGYWFFQQYKSATERRYALCRVVAGVVTVLDDVAMTNTYSPGDNVQGEFAPRKLRMEVTGVGGTVTIKVIRHRLGFDETVIDFPDSDAARIVAAGRCGLSLHMPGTWNAGASSSATSLLYFKVDDMTTPSVPVELVRDEFGVSRTDRLGARLTPADQLSKQGRSMMCGWTGDSQGQDDSTRIHHSQLLSDADDAKVGDNLPASNAFGWHVSMRPNPSVVSAFHRSASVKVLNSSTVAREVGMVLRFLPVGVPATDYSADSDTDKACYATVILYDGAPGNFTAELRSYRPSVPHVVIATAAVSDTALATIVFGTAFTLDFEVQTVDGSRIVLRSKIGATAVAWTSAAAGVSANGEWVLDDRGVGLVNFVGPGEGFFFDTAASEGATPYVTVDTWTEVALSSVSGLGGTPDHLWPSVEMQSETFGLVGTLNVDHSWPVTEDGKFLQNRTGLRSGAVTVFPRTRTNRRRWTIHANAVTGTQRAALQTFYGEHRGPEQPFSWATPGGETVFAKFEGQNLGHALLPGGAETFDFGLIEVFADPAQGTFPDVGWDAITPDNAEAGGSAVYRKIHREDDHLDEIYTVRLSAPAPVGGTTVAYLLGGDAIESTDYAVQSGASPLTFAAGTSTKTVTINFFGNTAWHHERLLTLTLTPAGSSQVNSLTVDQNQLRIYIQPDTLMPAGLVTPPVMDFDGASSSYSGGPEGGLHSVPLTITPDTGGTDEDVQAHYVVTGTGVEGTDYTLGVAQGGELVDVSEGNTGSLHVNVLPGFTAARTVILTLDYEAAGGGDMNLQNNTGNNRFEFPDGDLGAHTPPGHGEYPFPADSGPAIDGTANALAGTLPLNLRPFQHFVDPVRVHPDTGKALEGFYFVTGAPLAAEWLNSNENEIYCDGAEVLHQFKAYNRFSVFVAPPSAASGHVRSRFLRTEIWNQNADLRFAVHWDSESTTGGLLGGGPFVDEFGLSWGIDSFSKDFGTEGGAGNDFGVDVSNGRTRLWFVYNEDDIPRQNTDSHRSSRDIWPAPFGLSRFDATGGSLGGKVGGSQAFRRWNEGWLFYDLMYETSATVLSGAPGQFWPREGHYWRPRGNCLQGSTTTVHTVTL